MSKLRRREVISDKNRTKNLHYSKFKNCYHQNKTAVSNTVKLHETKFHNESIVDQYVNTYTELHFIVRLQTFNSLILHDLY
jgi:hypothetical protein